MSNRPKLVALSAALAVVVGVVVNSSAQADVQPITRISAAGSVFVTAKSVPVIGGSLPAAGILGTQINWTGHSSSLTYGAAAVLKGQVTTTDGALPDAPVALYGRPAGDSWRYLGTRRSSTTDGVFRFDTHRPARNTEYRVEYRGEFLFGSSSATVPVKVRRAITSAMTRNSDGSFMLGGSVAPKVVGKTIRLQRKTCGTCSWSTIKSSTTSSTSTWRFRVTGSATPGTWYFRAYTPSDSGFLTSDSDIWLIKTYYG